MTSEKAKQFIAAWFAKLDGPDIPLFKTDDDGKTATLIVPRPRLMRSEELTDRLTEIRSQVQQAYANYPATMPEGICYLIYRRTDQGGVEPLYVGIAQAIGKTGKLSTLFNNGYWLRFDDRFNTGGHIGNLNDTIAGTSTAYSYWVKSLFSTVPDLNQSADLKRPVYVHVETWSQNSASVIPLLGHTPLPVEEMLRIWVLKEAGFGQQLLNRDGNRALSGTKKRLP